MPLTTFRLTISSMWCSDYEENRFEQSGRGQSVLVALWWRHLVQVGSQACTFPCRWEIDINVIFLHPYSAYCGSKRRHRCSRWDINSLNLFPLKKKTVVGEKAHYTVLSMQIISGFVPEGHRGLYFWLTAILAAYLTPFNVWFIQRQCAPTQIWPSWGWKPSHLQETISTVETHKHTQCR